MLFGNKKPSVVHIEKVSNGYIVSASNSRGYDNDRLNNVHVAKNETECIEIVKKGLKELNKEEE